MYVFKYLVKLGLLSGRLLGNSCSLGLRYNHSVSVPYCQSCFTHVTLVFGVGISDCAISIVITDVTPIKRPDAQQF